MNDFRNVITTDLKKAFCSPKIYGVMMLLLMCTFIDTLPSYITSDTDLCDMMYKKVSGAGSAMCLLAFCISVMPYSLQYYEECKNKSIYLYLNRETLTEYCISKIIAVCMSTFFVITVSNILYCLIMKMAGATFISEMFVLNQQENHTFLLSGMNLAFLCAVILTEALRGVFFAILSLCLSAYIKNLFLIVALPVVIYFGMGSFLFFTFNVPDWVNLSVIFMPLVIKAPDDLMSLMMTLAVTLLMILVFGEIFLLKVRREMKNGRI